MSKNKLFKKMAEGIYISPRGFQYDANRIADNLKLVWRIFGLIMVLYFLLESLIYSVNDAINIVLICTGVLFLGSLPWFIKISVYYEFVESFNNIIRDFKQYVLKPTVAWESLGHKEYNNWYRFDVEKMKQRPSWADPNKTEDYMIEYYTRKYGEQLDVKSPGKSSCLAFKMTKMMVREMMENVPEKYRDSPWIKFGLLSYFNQYVFKEPDFGDGYNKGNPIEFRGNVYNKKYKIPHGIPLAAKDKNLLAPYAYIDYQQKILVVPICISFFITKPGDMLNEINVKKIAGLGNMNYNRDCIYKRIKDEFPYHDGFIGLNRNEGRWSLLTHYVETYRIKDEDLGKEDEDK